MRFWEVDFARGIAVIAMVIFNWLYALGFLGIIQFNASDAFWWLYANCVVATFVFIAGISFCLAQEQGKNNFARGLKIFGCGIVITAATWAIVPGYAIVFGILHLIGVSIILGSRFNRFSSDSLAAMGLAAVIVGVILMTKSFGFPWLIWLGVIPTGFQTLDFEPLLPWFGIFLFGMRFAKRHYANGKRRFAIGEPRASLIRFIGRHSLAIYLLHVPALVLFLWLAGFDWLQVLKNS